MFNRLLLLFLIDRERLFFKKIPVSVASDRKIEIEFLHHSFKWSKEWIPWNI